MVVYPRWRGELNIGNGFAAAASGLSPLARGTRVLKRIRKARNSVYPRWRGEHDKAWCGERFGYGLSPLARGTRALDTTTD